MYMYIYIYICIERERYTIHTVQSRDHFTEGGGSRTAKISKRKSSQHVVVMPRFLPRLEVMFVELDVGKYIQTNTKVTQTRCNN